MDDPRRIPVAGPSITQAEIDAVAQATRSGWYEGAGVFQARFEQAFAASTGRRFAVSLPSCTAALHLSLAGLGIGPGDEVIVPELTWIATAAPIAYVGAQAVFADVDERSLCLTTSAVAACLTERTRAIIAVDL
jgi:perosamine synthetase